MFRFPYIINSNKQISNPTNAKKLKMLPSFRCAETPKCAKDSLPFPSVRAERLSLPVCGPFSVGETLQEGGKQEVKKTQAYSNLDIYSKLQ